MKKNISLQYAFLILNGGKNGPYFKDYQLQPKADFS